jgi:hypothetical protein
VTDADDEVLSAPDVREEELVEGSNEPGLIRPERDLPRGVTVAHGQHQMP